MSYRPITDMWLLTRAALKDGKTYYGSYPGGFLSRARALLGCSLDSAVLHVCSGMVRYYPYAGFGSKDQTLDLDPACEPDFLQDAREPFPLRTVKRKKGGIIVRETVPWDGILMDPPYTESDAMNYFPGAADKLPTPNQLMRNAYAVVKPGHCIGLLHYILPALDKEKSELVATVGVLTGNNNRIRIYCVQRRK